jgi:hypothetical protein
MACAHPLHVGCAKSVPPKAFPEFHLAHFFRTVPCAKVHQLFCFERVKKVDYNVKICNLFFAICLALFFYVLCQDEPVSNGDGQTWVTQKTFTAELRLAHILSNAPVIRSIMEHLMAFFAMLYCSCLFVHASCLDL